MTDHDRTMKNALENPVRCGFDKAAACEAKILQPGALVSPPVSPAARSCLADPLRRHDFFRRYRHAGNMELEGTADRIGGFSLGPRGRRLIAGGLLVLVVALASCTASGGQTSIGQAHRSLTTTTAALGPTAPPQPEVRALTIGSALAEQPGWTPVSYGSSGIAVDQRTVTVPGGRSIVVTRFRFGQVTFDLHVGSTDPPVGNAVIGPQDSPVVSADERPLLLAAFNGGFKAGAGVGGFEVDHQVLVPLVVGAASLVIDTTGVAHIGRWGQDLPYPKEHVVSVRQNLAPLIVDSVISPNISDIGVWGATLGGGAVVARSAVGEDAQGNILYAASMQALPIDVADALTAAGATSAMQLDINPNWIELALTKTAGGPLIPGIPGQNRPADQYLFGWTRDFVTVLAI